MKYILYILILFSAFFFSCSENKDQKSADFSILRDTLLLIPDTTVDESLLYFDRQNSIWFLNDERYSGYSVRLDQNNLLVEKIGFFKGRKQNKAIRWYADGHLQEVAHYDNGKLHGEKKRWSSDTSHLLIAQLTYHMGKAHGVQKQWYPSGELYKLLNLNMGKEEGIQQAYRKNGELYANYEAKNGRIFGLRKAALCYGVEDEKVQYEN